MGGAVKWHRYGLAPSGPVCNGISWKSKDQGTRKGTGGSSATLTSSDLKSDGDPTDASQKSLASAEEDAGAASGPAEPRCLQVTSLGRTPGPCCEHPSCSTVKGHSDGIACQPSQQGCMAKSFLRESHPKLSRKLNGCRPRDEDMVASQRGPWFHVHKNDSFLAGFLQLDLRQTPAD